VTAGEAGGPVSRGRPGEPRDLATAAFGCYRYWQEAVTEPRHYSGGHLSALGADELLFDARSRYFADAVPLPGPSGSFWLVYRHLVLDYVGEAFAGEPLRCGVRAVSRGKRSIRMRQTLEVVGKHSHPVAHSKLIVVAFDVVRRVAIEVPAELWDAVVAFESGCRPGTSIPSTNR
jgi:acyl-CoA thioesterase FadM